MLDDPPLRLDWRDETVSACVAETRGAGPGAQSIIEFVVPVADAGRRFELSTP